MTSSHAAASTSGPAWSGAPMAAGSGSGMGAPRSGVLGPGTGWVSGREANFTRSVGGARHGLSPVAASGVAAQAGRSHGSAPSQVGREVPRTISVAASATPRSIVPTVPINGRLRPAEAYDGGTLSHAPPALRTVGSAADRSRVARRESHRAAGKSRSGHRRHLSGRSAICPQEAGRPAARGDRWQVRECNTR